MRVNSALIIDEIKVHDDGRVDLIGLREDLYFETVPVILQSLSLFVEMEVSPTDRGKKHVLELRLSDNAGKVTHSAPIQFTIPAEHDRPIAHLDPTLFEITFERYGVYHLDMLIDGVRDRRIYLNALSPDDEDDELVVK